MIKLAIVGAGDLGQQIGHSAMQNNVNVVGYFDDVFFNEKEKYSLPILGKTTEIIEAFTNEAFTHIIIAVGYNNLGFKKNLQKELQEKNIPFYSVISKSAIIDESAIIGDGVYIMAGVVIDQRSFIGDGVVLNCNVTVSHDTIIGEYCFLGPSVTLSGYVTVEEKVFIGSGSILSNNIKVSSNILIGAGSVVISDCNDSGVYVGVPAKKK